MRFVMETPESASAISAQSANMVFEQARKNAVIASMKWTTSEESEMIGKNRNPVSVSSIGGSRWTLLQQTDRGVAMNGVYNSPDDALDYAAELGLEVVDEIEEKK